jgi:3-oxoacyl-[acyl-carrier protein] reductase
VVVVYASHEAEANAAVAEAVKAGGEAIAVAADVADEVAMAGVFDRAEQEFGGVI